MIDDKYIKRFDWKELDGKNFRVNVGESEGIQATALTDLQDGKIYFVDFKNIEEVTSESI